MILAFFTLLLLAGEYFGVLSSRTPRTPKLPAWVWVAVLAVSYAVQLGVILYAALNQPGMPDWRLSMPIPVIDDRGLPTANGDLVTAVMLILAALQSYALLALYRLQLSRKLLLAGCGLLLVMSLFAPALMSFDMYGYVRGAVLGIASYTPADIPFSGDYHILNLWFNGPIYTLYGPLWIVMAQAVTAAAPTFFAKLVSFRVFGVLLYVAFLAGLRACGAKPRMMAIAALNPGLMLEYVANAHNDFIAIVLIVFAAAMMRARPLVGLGLVAVAGLVKLPYAIFGLPVLAAIRPVWLRYTGAFAMLAVVIVVSWTGGGPATVPVTLPVLGTIAIPAYIATLVGHVGSRPEDIIHRFAGLVAIVALFAAMAGMRRYRTVPWVVPQIAAAVFAWYLVWGLPYALNRHRALSYLLVCFPLVVVLIESAFLQNWSVLFVIPGLALVSLFMPERKAAKA
jgi:hypothetical protein